ncbi:hypothetical protein ElyMa_006251200 [Elysia marginata]|uniref:Uncharacterized protein n=1 Tax=Elysia marginata TaxID=1093978 RepID=A0AAV4H9V7_9GAST|nr:hypothetical protein ElyMa_006251200 [Elysia marginata]
MVAWPQKFPGLNFTVEWRKQVMETRGREIRGRGNEKGIKSCVAALSAEIEAFSKFDLVGSGVVLGRAVARASLNLTTAETRLHDLPARPFTTSKQARRVSGWWRELIKEILLFSPSQEI